MNTMIGYTLEQETDGSGKVMHTLLMLARQFLNQTDKGIPARHVWDSQQLLPNVPPRVWKRHSALLTLLVDQAEQSVEKHNDGK